jgi:hypothetical protein
MSCTAAGEGLVAGLVWTEGAAAEEAEAEEGIVEGVEAGAEVAARAVLWYTYAGLFI